MRSVPMSTTQTQVQVNQFIRSVYNWMGAGLALTGVIAYFVSNSPAIIQFLFANQAILFGLFIAELAIVFYLSARIGKMQAATATGMFMLYAGLNGLTLAPIFLIYTQASIVSTFFICAATFGAASLFGMSTGRDLTSMGNFMFMGLIGIIIATVVNLFLRSPAVSMVVSYIGVIVFVGLTAYDTQQIKSMALTQPADLDSGTVRKGAIFGALKLYLDFINLFLMLLRILGNRE